ncbi:DUF4411 family protein [Methanobrevibacter filiformis]|uniref:DUF4411 domain-containing protein n=1 Tax=Methanobrevibacter filiformis TaxID=55758 RepID=A0A166DZF5_9EURY|nr:DUF4411 family protein [Methanobrevibacter filiformis]KZX16114.1 hypothetical protein MBFIL_05580 [Methanobrevibacter filiformis]
MKYVVDTSTILAGSQYETYEKEFFPNHWGNFNKLIQEEIIVSTPAVQKEIYARDDKFTTWAKENKNMFIPLSQEVIERGNELSKRFPLWYKTGENKKHWADPEIIAFAKINNIILVTQENWNSESTKEEKYKIPTICEKIGAKCHIKDNFHENVKVKGFQCIDLLELIKREELHNITF